MRRGWLMLLLVPLSAGADVFQRHPGGIPADWTRAYEAPVQLQNSRGDLQWFATDGSLQSIHNRLLGWHGDALAWMPGENVAWGLALEDGWLTRYLVQPRPRGEGFWILVLKQREREAGRPGESPRRHQLRDVPVFAHSEPTLFVKDDGTHLALEVSTTPAAPGAVLDQLTDQMKSDGWQESPANTGGLRWFLKRDRVALISANIGKDGITRILRLHKPLGVQ